MKRNAQERNDSSPGPGLLILAGLILALSALRAGGYMLPDNTGKRLKPAGYIQVKEDGKKYFMEMSSERMRATDIFPGVEDDFLIESGDAVELYHSTQKDTIPRHFSRGMDNPSRYVLGEKMMLARATAFELSLVPGLGKVRAERIINAWRQRGGFKNWEQVKSRPEVTDGIFSALRERFFITEPFSGDGGVHAGPAGKP